MIKTINRTNIIISVIVLFSAIILGCKEKVIYTGYEEESLNYQFSKFIKNIPTFPYEATPEKRDKIVRGFSKISVGINKTTAKELIGEPDAEVYSYETTNGKKYSGSSWGYYLRRQQAELANEKYDQTVFLYFDPDEKLYWAHPDNIELLKDKGGPNLRRR
jgi:hypothetical protein